MKQILILIVTVFATLPLRAQYEYTLRQCLEEGLLNNYSLRISRNEEQISKNNATLGNAGYLPTVDFKQCHFRQCGLSAYGRLHRGIYRRLKQFRFETPCRWKYSIRTQRTRPYP